MSDERGRSGPGDRSVTAFGRRSNTDLADEPLAHFHGAALTLAAVTGLFHLVVGFRYYDNAIGSGFMEWLGLGVMGTGVAFLACVALAAAGIGRRPLYRLGIPFVAGQMVAWYWFNRPIDSTETLGIVDKTVQAGLIAVLIVLVRDG